MSLSSIEIQNHIHECDEQIDRLSNAFNKAEGDEQAAIHDQICELKGKKASYYDILPAAVEAEEAVRAQGGVPMANSGADKPFTPRTVADLALGPRDKFTGLAVDRRVDFDVMDAYTEFGLGKREETSYDLPTQYPETLPSFGVLNTLPKATTTADVLTFFKADLAKYVNNAALWEPGNAKPTSSMAWVQDNAVMELIANGMPVLETQLKDYGQLRAMIDVNLMLMQNLVKASKVVKAPVANKAKGIVGIINHEGILKYAKKSAKETVADSIRRQKTDVFLASGFQPTTVAMHPYVSEAVELEKDANGRYINMMVNGRLWGLQVVEDMNLTETTGDTGNEKTTYGLLTYWPQAAIFYNREAESIVPGVVNDQFMRNELTLRIEGRYGLQVTYEKAFSYLADTGITR